MTATPAQVANDLDAQAAYFSKSEAKLAQTCSDCARAIRVMLTDGKIDRATYSFVHAHILDMEDRCKRRNPGSQIAKSVSRGRETLQALHGQLVRAAQ